MPLNPVGPDDQAFSRAEALHESERQFRSLADNMSQLAWIADPGGRIYWYNQRWYSYTGTSHEAMMALGWRSLYHPDHLQRVESRLRRCFATGSIWEDTFPLRGKDGLYRWFLSRALPIRDESGNITYWLGTSTDITAQVKAEDAQTREKRTAIDAMKEALSELTLKIREVQIGLENLVAQIDERPPIDVRVQCSKPVPIA